jgi:hypothetical protein
VIARATSAAAISAASRPKYSSHLPLMMATCSGACIAANRKISELAQKASFSQLSTRFSQLVGVSRRRPPALIVIAAEATATTPDTPR